MRLGFTCTLRFYTPSLFDIFNTSNAFKWCIMPSYKSIAMIKVTKLSNYNHMSCKHLPKTDLIHRQVMRPLRHGGSHFVNVFWHGNQYGSDVTSRCAVTSRWHCRKQTALIAESIGIIWNICSGWEKPPNLPNSCNITFPWWYCIWAISIELFMLVKDRRFFQRSPSTRYCNEYFILIHPLGRVAVTWRNLGWNCIRIILAIMTITRDNKSWFI